jgi:hypothetical protein
MKQKLHLFLVILSASIQMSWAQPLMADLGDELTPVEHFVRCYKVMVRTIPDYNDPLYLAVKNGTKAAEVACMDLFNKAALITSGVDEGRLVTHNDPVSQEILRTFWDLFRTSFTKTNLYDRAETFSVYETYVNEHNQAALAYLRVLLHPNSSVTDILYSEFQERAIRAENVGLKNTMKGKIFGVTKLNTNNFHDLNNNVINNFPLPHVYRREGNGLFADQAFQMANIPVNVQSTGGFKMVGRVMAKAILDDVLCLEAPYLRSQDTAAQVIEYQNSFPNVTQQIPFRANGLCAGCHAAMDPLAAGFRKIIFNAYDSDVRTLLGTNTQFLTEHPSDYGYFPQSKFHLVHDQNNYSHFNPQFELKFRSYISNQVVTISEMNVQNSEQAWTRMGEIIAERPEFYACYAKKIFKMFTGINANFRDQNPLTGTLSAGDQYYRDYVINLGLELQAHKNPRLTIKTILESNIFKNRSLRAKE